MDIFAQVNQRWLLYLAVPSAWALLFSFFNRQPVRGLRNFGLLGCYLVGIVMAFRLPWRQSMATWLVPAVAAGVLYFLYEVISYFRAKEKDTKPRLATLINGVFAWPLMLPEVIEYSLAEAGVLRAADPPPATPKSDGDAGVA